MPCQIDRLVPKIVVGPKNRLVPKIDLGGFALLDFSDSFVAVFVLGEVDIDMTGLGFRVQGSGIRVRVKGWG